MLGVDQVLRVKRLNLADGEPFAVVTVWCPAELGRRLSREDVEQRPFYELLDIPLRGATQTIGADAAERRRRRAARRAGRRAAAALPAGHHRHAGRPVLISEHLFPAHRTEFVVELPLAEPSISPAGLRLVESSARRSV